MKVNDYYEYLMATGNLDKVDKETKEELEDFVEEDLDLSELDLEEEDFDFDELDDENEDEDIDTDFEDFKD